MLPFCIYRFHGQGLPYRKGKVQSLSILLVRSTAVNAIDRFVLLSSFIEIDVYRSRYMTTAVCILMTAISLSLRLSHYMRYCRTDVA